MILLITILSILTFGFVLFSVWAWLKKSDAVSEIVAMAIFFGFVTFIAWGITTDDKNGIIPFLASKLEKPLSLIIFFANLFSFYLFCLNLKNFYQKIKNNNCYWSDIFSFIVSEFALFVLLFILIVQNSYYSMH